MRLFKVKLIGNDAPLYLKGNTLTDALEGAGHGRDVFDVLETVTEIEEAIAMLNALYHKYVRLNDMLEMEGATPLTLCNAASIGLTQNSTDKEIEQMAKNRALDELQEFDDDSDDDEDWEGDDLISLIGK
jgi:hypothetical protein